MSDDQLKEQIARLERELEQCREHADSLGNLLERKLTETYTLYHVARTTGSVLEVQELLRQVSGIIKKSIAFDRMSVYLVDERREGLELCYYSGLDVGGKVTLALGEGLPGRIAETGEHSHLHDLAVFYDTFSDFIHVPGEVRRDGSYIGIALKARGATLGVIGIDSGSKYGLSVDDMDFMAILSHQIAAGIEKARLFEKIQHLSQRDGLTGLYNQRMFWEKLQQELNRRARSLAPLSLVMIDIDHFKRFNDNYGHQEGDSVLRELAAVLVHQCRANTIDMICRYGGEEFTIIMPELELHRAVTVAERIRAAIEHHPFGVRQRHPEASVTVSLGVATVSGDEDLGPEELLKKADEALYLAKQSGRNRISYSPRIPD